MQLTNLLILGAALGATAHPSGHAHRHVHEQQEKRDPAFYKAVHTTKTVVVEVTADATSEVTVAATTSSTSVAAVVTTSSTSTSSVAASTASSSSSSSSTGYVEFCSSSSKRATSAEIAYVGNTGSTYGCNIMEIDTSIVDLYNYTMLFTNVDSQSYQLICWNKIGSDGEIDGFFKGKGEAVTTTIAAGASIAVAFESNSQGACGFGAGELATSSYGEYLGTWVEFDFDNTSNDGWSGADCSSLAAASASGSIYGCQVCYDSTCSTILSDGSGTNSYVAGTADEDGLGLNIDSSTVHLTVSVGYSD